MAPPSDDLNALNVYTILHGLPVAVTLANSEGRILFSNSAADLVLGTAAAREATPDEWSEHYGVFLPDGSAPFPTEQYPLVRALSGEHTRDVEMLIRNESVPDGALVAVSGQPVRNADGSIAGAAVAFRDVTELRRSQRLREEMAAFLAHDLKNPLTAIMSTCDLLERSGLEDRLADDVRSIREAAKRIHGMVMDLLDVQTAEDGALEPDPSEIELAALLAEVAAASAPRLELRGQKTELDVATGLTVVADRSLLFRVLMNLVDNCWKYGPENGTIWIDAQASDDGVVMSVRDEGPGVPPELREKIFEKYARVERDEGRRSRDSRGLGLRFCKVVAEAQGGRIWVEDAEPRGARFCIELPRGS